ncbi:MAG: hypothetical protein ACN4GZ_05245 [Acidimicrobiales bacterium]
MTTNLASDRTIGLATSDTDHDLLTLLDGQRRFPGASFTLGHTTMLMHPPMHSPFCLPNHKTSLPISRTTNNRPQHLMLHRPRRRFTTHDNLLNHGTVALTT